MKYLKHILPNGCRLIFTPMPQSHSVGINLIVGVGSRHETKEVSGLSHFIEHMAFKGTKSFKDSKEVSEAVEGVGGILNAYTSESLTNYHAKVVPEHFGQAFQVIADLVLHPRLRPQDIDDERGVILEEINRKEDDPQEKVMENIARFTFADHPLGWPTLGRPEVIKSLKRQDFLGYRQSRYTSSSMVVSVAGNVSEEAVLKKFQEDFGPLSGSKRPSLDRFFSRQKEPQVFLEEKKTEQAHFCLSLRGLNLLDERRYALSLLNSVLGAGMSSRLFLNIREKGLAYSVGSFPDLVIDTGALFVFAGFNVARIKEALKAVLAELKRLKEELVGEAEFAKALEKQKGPMLFHLEDPEAVAGWYGNQEIGKDEIQTEEELLQRLSGVSRTDIQSLAQDLFRPENLNLAIIGPYEQKKKDELLELLKF